MAVCSAELEVIIEPSKRALRENVENYIGSLGDRDEQELLRYSRIAQQQAEKALQALGYYHGQFDSEVSGGENPRLTLRILPGEPVRLRDDPAVNAADVELVFVSGPRYALGEVRFEGDSPFDPDLLARMVPFDAGTPYDSELVAELTQAMQSSGYFEGVRVDANPANAQQQRIPVAVQLTTREPRTPGPP